MNCILKRFIKNYKKNPNGVVVCDQTGKWTWKELFKNAFTIAFKLEQLKVKKGDCVTIELPNVKEFVASIVACQILGAVYIPAGVSNPPERIKHIRKDCNAKAIINADFIKSLDFNNHKEIKPVDKQDDQIEMIIYTSGSTGNPKGVIHSVSSLYDAITDVCFSKEVNYKIKDRYATAAPLSFILGIQVLLMCLILNDVIFYLVPLKLLNNPQSFLQYFIDNKINKAILNDDLAKLFRLKKTYIKRLFVGGNIARNCSIEDIKVFNGYGSSELGGASTFYHIKNNLENTPIGKPLPRYSAYILNENNEEVDKGELCISGNMALGYQNLTEESQKSFITNPFYSKDGNKRMFRTGDIAKKDEDDNIIILGRKDLMVKVNGQRVELEEIEYKLKKIEGIKDAAVKYCSNNQTSYIAAFYTSNKNLKTKYIEEQLSSMLASYMIPKFFKRLKSIPVLPNGKTDRKSLPYIDIEDKKNEYVAPTNKIEKNVCEAYQKVFNLEKVGINDDFIDLGGDSLSAIKVLSLLDGYSVNTSMVLDLKTPKKIAKTIEEKSAIKKDLYTINSNIRLTNNQLNVYLDQLTHKSNTTYRINFNIDTGTDDTHKVKEALHTLFKTHPILSMKVKMVDSNPCFVKGSKPKIIEISDKNNINYSIDLDLETGPLCVVYVYKKGSNVSATVIVHHIIFDGKSQDVFKNHFYKILDGKKLKKDLDFLKTASINTHYEENDLFKQTKLMYKDIMSDIDVIPDLLSIENGYNGYVAKKFKIKTDEVNSFAIKNNTTEAILFDSIFALTLSCFTDDDKAVFTITENGRDEVDAYNSIGMFVKSIPIVIDCNYKKFGDFINNAKNILLKARNNPYLSFAYLNKKYGLTNTIMFQYFSNFIDIKFNKKMFDNKDIIKSHEDKKNASTNLQIADLDCYLVKDENYFYLYATHSNKYTNEYIESILNTFEKVLNEIVINNKEVNDIEYVSNKDKKLFESANNTEVKLKYNNILDAFADSVKKYPNNIALTCKDKKYTYKQLDEITNGIANYLQKLGCHEKELVAIIEDTNEYLLINSLSVLKCGCAYLPINSTYPIKWMENTINEANISKVITSLDEKTYSFNDNIKILNTKSIKAKKHFSTPKVKDKQAFCVIATSGTTGKPKLVEINHIAVINLCLWKIKYIKIGQNDVFAMFANYSFVSHIESMLSSLLVGASTLIIPKDIKLNIFELKKYLQHNKATNIQWGVSIGKEFLKYSKSTNLKNYMLGGEKLGTINIYANLNIIDEYGPSETTAETTAIFIKDKIVSESVGFPIYNTKVYVLDKNKKQKPLYAQGSIHASGLSLANGYINDKNNINFSDNPYSENEDYSRIFNINDKGRYLQDGSIGYIGRKDSQVNVKGNRVELGEVEKTIEQCNFVKKSIVLVHDINNKNGLVAYVVLDKDRLKNKKSNNYIKQEITQYVSKHKPNYMVPAHVIVLDKIPLNANGKVDRRALPRPDITKLTTKYIPPTNNIERNVCKAFERIFDVDKVGIQDDFFVLGASSLNIIELLSYLREYTLNVDVIKQHSTPRSLAGYIQKNCINSQIDKIDETLIYPLSNSQIDVYRDIVLNDHNALYNLMNCFLISNTYSQNDVKNAYDTLLKKVPVLKARMISSDKITQAKYLCDAKPKLKTFNANNVKNTKKDIFNTISYWLLEEFDIYNELFRCALLLYKNYKIIIFTCHHLIFDGFSIKNLTTMFQSCLENKDFSTDYGMFKSSIMDNKPKQAKLIDKANAYFKDILSISSSLQLEPNHNGKSGLYGKTLRNSSSKNIKSIVSSKDNQEIFYTIFALLLSKVTGKEKIYFTAVYNGREYYSAYSSVGMFSKIIPVALEILPKTKVYDLIRQVDYILKTSAKNISYVSYHELVNKYNIDSNIIFKYQSTVLSINDNEDENKIKRLLFDKITSAIKNQKGNDQLCEIEMNVEATKENIAATILYSKLHNNNFIMKFIDRYNEILKKFDKDITVEELFKKLSF